MKFYDTYAPVVWCVCLSPNYEAVEVHLKIWKHDTRPTLNVNRSDICHRAFAFASVNNWQNVTNEAEHEKTETK